MSEQNQAPEWQCKFSQNDLCYVSPYKFICEGQFADRENCPRWRGR